MSGVWGRRRSIRGGASVAGGVEMPGVVRSGVPHFKDQALCLRAWDWSETSQTAVLFGRETGLLRVLAKGSRRPWSAFSGGLMPLTRGEAAGIRKPSTRLVAGDSAGLTTLTAWDLQEVFPGVRRTLTGFYGGMHMAELLLRLFREGDPHPALFDDAVAALRALGDARAGISPVVRLQWSVLTHGGHRPEVVRDVTSGGPLPRRGVYGFLPERGGLTADSSAAGAWRVRSATVEYLRRLAEGSYPAGEPATEARAAALLGRYAEWVLGAGLSSLPPLISATGHAEAAETPKESQQNRGGIR